MFLTSLQLVLALFSVGFSKTFFLNFSFSRSLEENSHYSAVDSFLLHPLFPCAVMFLPTRSSPFAMKFRGVQVDQIFVQCMLQYLYRPFLLSPSYDLDGTVQEKFGQIESNSTFRNFPFVWAILNYAARAVLKKTRKWKWHHKGVIYFCIESLRKNTKTSAAVVGLSFEIWTLDLQNANQEC